MSAQLGAGVVFLAGMGLMFFYVHSVDALGTNYGVMVLAKIALFAIVLLLGGLNHLVAWRSQPETMSSLVRPESSGRGRNRHRLHRDSGRSFAHVPAARCGTCRMIGSACRDDRGENVAAISQNGNSAAR